VYKWLLDTVHGKQGKTFHIAHFKEPYSFTDSGFKIFNRVQREFNEYIENVHYGAVGGIVDNCPLQYELDFYNS
jgi:hypothetical protein